MYQTPYLMNGNQGNDKLHSNHSNNHQNNKNVTFYDLNKEDGIKNRLPNLRYHVFISKETTKELSDYILPEPWGDENGLLYKYLDYVWRCQLFDRQIKKFYCRNEGKLVFHSGLQRRSDGEFVYLLLIRNDADSNKKVDQKWRVALGIQNGLHSRNMSFVTKQELLKHYWRYDESLLPKRTLFYNSEKDLIFHTNYRFEIDWEERLRTCKNRIYKTLSNDGNRKGSSSNIDESVLPIKELQRRFEAETAKSIALSRANPRIGVPQAFIESKNGGYRLELLIPLTLYFNNRVYYFALALRPHHDDQIYEGMSILTREMAYANARLVGSIDSHWLTTRFATDNAGAAQHCSCTCHNFCNTGINPDHIHNLSDHKRKYNNDIPSDATNLSKNKPTQNILSPRHNNSHSSYHSHQHQLHQQPKLNRTHSQDSNPYLNNTQNRNNPHNLNLYMNGMGIMNNMYNTANPYSLSMNSPNTAANKANGAINTTATNPFSFVTTATTPTAANINPYNPYTAPTTNNSYNLSSILNPAFITSVPNVNVPTVPPSTGTPLKTPLFTPNMSSNASHSSSSNQSPSRSNQTTNTLQINTSNVGTATTTSATSKRLTPTATTTTGGTNPGGLPFLTPTTPGIHPVGNTPLAAYGIPTIGPPCLAGSSVVNIPIAQMSTPQSIASSVPSSVPINPIAATAIPALSNTIKTMSTNFGNSNLMNKVNNHINNVNQTKMNNNNINNMNHTLNNNNNQNVMNKAIINGKKESNNVVVANSTSSKIAHKTLSNGNSQKLPNNVQPSKSHNVAKMVENVQQKKSQNLVDYQPEPISVGDIEHKHQDNHHNKQGFTDDMFADASPRTKEIFNGLTFDEEDEVYSLQPSRTTKNKPTPSQSGNTNRNRNRNNGDNQVKNGAMPRAKSFHTKLHNDYHQNILSKTPTSHPPTSSSWKSASYNDLNVNGRSKSGPPEEHDSNASSPHTQYPANSASRPRDNAAFHVRRIGQTQRQHSHDGIHRTKSEHNMVMVNARDSSNGHRPFYAHGSSQRTQRSQRSQQQQAPHHHNDVFSKSGYYGGSMLHSQNEAAATRYNDGSNMYPSEFSHSNGPSEAFLNGKMARMTKSHSQPSLADMMTMSVHDQFQEFQNLSNQNEQQQAQKSSNDGDNDGTEPMMEVFIE